MIGVELSVDGAPIVEACLERRLLINCTHGTVLRLLPALNLTDAELDEGCDILEEVVSWHSSRLSAASSVATGVLPCDCSHGRDGVPRLQATRTT